jgi:hypothetical protein
MFALATVRSAWRGFRGARSYGTQPTNNYRARQIRWGAKGLLFSMLAVTLILQLKNMIYGRVPRRYE